MAPQPSYKKLEILKELKETMTEEKIKELEEINTKAFGGKN